MTVQTTPVAGAAKGVAKGMPERAGEFTATAPAARQALPEGNGLVTRYGAIGIEAVAAAARYAERPAAATRTVKALRIDPRFMETAI